MWDGLRPRFDSFLVTDPAIGDRRRDLLVGTIRWSGRVGRRRVEEVGDHTDRHTQMIGPVAANAGSLE